MSVYQKYRNLLDISPFLSFEINNKILILGTLIVFRRADYLHIRLIIIISITRFTSSK